LPKNNRYANKKRNIRRLEEVEGEPIPQAACIAGSETSGQIVCSETIRQAIL
jgi:hypothetical protein